MEIYVVKPEDSLEQIANEFAVTEDTIIEDNQLQYPFRLVPGQALLINNGMNEQTVAARSTGYLYPFIDREVFENTLPHLSFMQIFSYGFDGYGNLYPPVYDDSELVVAGLEQGVVSVLTLTPLTEEQTFDSRLIFSIVRNEFSQDQLFENLVEEMQDKGYIGLNIDFEYVDPDDRDLYTEFVRRCTEYMHEYGFTVSVALAPKTSAEQTGLLYEGIDYRALGEIADTVILMTYEWGYTYGPPMAVAPLDKVEQVVKYAVTEIPSEKIMLGIPNYGYDWPLPFVRGVTAAESIGNVEAVQRAEEFNAEILYDETAQSPYFLYTNEGTEHEVWFEDVRSLQAKFDLIKKYQLRGASYWQLMRFFKANWLLFEDNFIVLPGV